MASDANAAKVGRTTRKRHGILTAARTLFLARGYAGTSMDDVAALAEVSKQTIYKQFTDKSRLFAAVLNADIEQAELHTKELVDALGTADDVATALRAFARQHVVDVLQPHLVRLRRLVIAEADRFPELARAWYTRGPEKGHATLATQFAALAERGLLRVPDPLLAAEQFNWLVLSVPLNRAMFGVLDDGFSRAEFEAYADEAVRVFLAAYG